MDSRSRKRLERMFKKIGVNPLPGGQLPEEPAPEPEIASTENIMSFIRLDNCTHTAPEVTNAELAPNP